MDKFAQVEFEELTCLGIWGGRLRTAQPEVISVGGGRLETSKVGIVCCDNSCVWVEIAEAL